MMAYIVVCAVTYFAEGIILYLYASSLFTPHHGGLRKNIFSLSILYLILFLLMICFQNRSINIIAFFLANFLYLLMQYSINWFLCIFHSAVITSLMAASEIIVYVIQRKFLSNSPAIGNVISETIVFGIFSKLLYFIAVLLVFRTCIKRPVSHPQDKYSTLFLIFVPCASIFTMIVMLNIIDRYTLSPLINNMIVLAFILLLFANLLVFCIYQYMEEKGEKYTQLMLLLQKEEAQAEYYEMLNIQNENQRILIHDIKKHLQSIEALNEKQEYDKIRSYIRQLTISSGLQETSIVCDHRLLNAILCRYSRECQEKQIAFHADIRSGSLDFLADNHVTSLFCNLLDNAIEAAHGIPDSYIELSCSIREKTPFTVITVINSCKGDPFQTNDSSHKALMRQNLQTNKKNKSSHGFGLKSIRRTVNYYNGDIQMYYHADSNSFHTIITLKKQVETTPKNGRTSPF